MMIILQITRMGTSLEWGEVMLEVSIVSLQHQSDITSLRDRGLEDQGQE